MQSNEEIESFWGSLITENGISRHVESLMKIRDTEERSLALMSRVFFLWCMGIKYQREDLKENTFNLIQSILKKSSDTKGICSKCAEIKILLEKIDFVKSPNSLNDRTNISSKRRNLSNSPPQLLKKFCTRDKENIESSPKKCLSVEILAPETEPFLQMKDSVIKEFIIPETVPGDEVLYGNTDFFNASLDSNEKSPVLDKCNTSPILGKIYKSSNSPAIVKNKAFSSTFIESTNLKHDMTSTSSCMKGKSPNNVKGKSPDKVKGKSPNNVKGKSPHKVKGKSPEKIINSPDSMNNSPSLLGCNIINQIPVLSCSTSSDKGTKNITSLTKNIDSKEEKSLTPSKSKFTTDIAKNSLHVNRTLRSTSSRNSLLKSKSEMSGVLSNRGRLSRLKTLTALKDVNPKLEVSVEPNEKKKKIYKQTKITQDFFLKRANIGKLTGEKCDLVNIIEENDEEKALEQAIEASIHSKEIEDFLRKKHQQIEKESPKIKKKVNKSPVENSLRKSPRTKCQKSLKFSSPSKGNNSKVSEEEVPEDLENDLTIKDKEEDSLAKARKIKKNVFQDSFDVLPTKNSEPNYAYKGNVARKNIEKQRLDGWNCHECRDYYESKDLTEEQRKALQNKCSRHRSKYRPLTNTPEGFWNVGWSDEEET
ncbi:DNA endonuclease RBBP8 [Armadillidium nasatum]|uniref:DNA endonuclease RBBP8 n=1 Tax=Armadillidium nasatum TaxID=96803 RepID=A0A5N5T3H6_9CRUS|nr:DNA endonuclease RBBP8 [Armadillidium nasatum]